MRKHLFEKDKKYGRLTLVEEFRDGIYVKWKCRCDCGGEISAVIQNIVKGATRSCGCLRVEAGKRRERHGQCRAKKNGGSTGLWVSHTSMMTRCYNPNATEYPRYGGRGIKVVERWHDIVNFMAYMGPRPAGCSIDRIDNNKDYGPDNCRWATDIEQCNNRRSNRFVVFNGETKTIAQWSRSLGLRAATISARLIKGWSPERALTTPVR